MADRQPGSDSPPEPLTEREREILACLTEGLSNHEIAAQLHLAPSTVKWYNSQIYSKLAVSSREEAVEQAQALGLLLEMPLDEAQSVARNNLPTQTTPFIGRQQELAEIADLLADPDLRLLTILAPGGMGKTRLGLAAAERQLRRFADGVFFVPLAPLSSPDDIVTTIAENVGFSFYGSDPPTQQLLDYFRERNSLLVLDNFEHLLDGAALVTDFLQAAPHIKVLATSREKLNLSGETVYMLSGLEFPTWETPEDALEYDAVQLFLQSAHRARPDFELQTDDLDYLARICRLTAGMPLGIVLAARWLDMLTLEQIAAEIQQGLDILETEMRDVPERQRSVRATFNYSWARLTEAEQRVFMKLSVFRGGFTSEAAETVTEASLRSLRKLVDKSLVHALPTGRYEVHELLRQFGEDKLFRAGEWDELRRLQGAYFANFMQEREADIKGRRQLESLNEIEADFNNIRAAWAWAADHRDEAALDAMLETLHLFCDLRSRFQEGSMLFEQAVSAMTPPGDQEPPQVWYRLKSRQAAIWLLPIERVEEAHHQLLACRQAAQTRRDQAELAFCILQIAEALQHTGAFEEISEYYDESLALFRAVDDRYYIGRTLRSLAFTHILMGHDYAEQQARVTLELIEQTRAMGDRAGMAHGILYLGLVRLYAANYLEAIPLLEEARGIWQEMGDRKSVAIAESALNFYRFLKGEFERVEAQANKNLSVGADANYPAIRAYGLNLLSRIASMNEDYETAHTLAETALGMVMLSSPWELTVAEVGLMDFLSARHHLVESLRYGLHHGDVVVLLRCLPVAAVVLLRDGHPERAAELLALGYTEPRAMTGWMERWPLLARLRNDLVAELGPAEFQAAWDAGQMLVLEQVVEELLAEFDGES